MEGSQSHFHPEMLGSHEAWLLPALNRRMETPFLAHREMSLEATWLSCLFCGADGPQVGWVFDQQRTLLLRSRDGVHKVDILCPTEVNLLEQASSEVEGEADGNEKICTFYYALHISLIRIFSMTPCVFQKPKAANKIKLFTEIFKSAYSSYTKLSK